MIDSHRARTGLIHPAVGDGDRDRPGDTPPRDLPVLRIDFILDGERTPPPPTPHAPISLSLPTTDMAVGAEVDVRVRLKT